MTTEILGDMISKKEFYPDVFNPSLEKTGAEMFGSDERRVEIAPNQRGLFSNTHLSAQRAGDKRSDYHKSNDHHGNYRRLFKFRAGGEVEH